MLETRYENAYAVARATMQTAKLVRLIGIGVAGLSLVIGIVCFCGEWLGSTVTAFACLGLGVMFVLFGLAVYGILAAQAEMMAAVLDTAINTSPVIDPEEKRRMLQAF